MIDRYTITFGPAVSQKELEKALHESGETPAHIPDLKQLKARIDVVGDFEDLKKISALLKQLVASAMISEITKGGPHGKGRGLC